jgi:hypothetical protein
MKIETVKIAKVEAQRFLEAVERLENQETILLDDKYPKSKYLSCVKRAALHLKLALMDLRSRG